MVCRFMRNVAAVHAVATDTKQDAMGALTLTTLPTTSQRPQPQQQEENKLIIVPMILMLLPRDSLNVVACGGGVSYRK